MIEITEASLDGLRRELMQKMSFKRFRHTVAVEDMVTRLCALFCPENTLQMRAAALLHDMTKELSAEEQVTLCNTYGLTVTRQDLLSPKTFHARTAAARIGREMPQFADPIVVDAVRWHTTGRADMTLTEKLLYLADYIDDSRVFENCVILRRYFWGAEPQSLSRENLDVLLRDTLILSFDMTVRDLLAEGAPIAEDTLRARTQLLVERDTAKGR